MKKCGYVRLWMGDEGYPYIEKWKATNELDFSTPEDVKDAEGRITANKSSGYKLKTYWDQLEKELKPKSKNILAIIELWTKCQQGNSPLTEWITKVYNVVGNCDYSELGENVKAVKDLMIRDTLIIGANSEKARDKIIREGTAVTLDRVITILQTEDSTTRTLSAFSSATKSMHYVKYDQKKGNKGGKGPGQKKTPSSTGTSTTPHNSTPKICFRCKREYIHMRVHKKECRALKAKCTFCGLIGHFEKCCRKAGNFPKKPHTMIRQQHIAASEGTSREGLDFYDEDGNQRVEKQMYMLYTKEKSSPRHINPQNDLLIEFGIGKQVNSINDKVILKIDTGADVNTLNRKTFHRLFPDIQLRTSSVILKNFDSTYIQPPGTFKCFLRWKGKRYRTDMEVMDSDDTPNVLSREQTFMMGILKQCSVVEKAFTTSSAGSKSIAKPVTPKKMDTKTEVKNFNITGPLTKDVVTTQFTDVFTGLGKFPGPPYELRLKPDAVPAKHRSRKVPVHLQSAFHEEVKRLVTQDVLEPVTEHTEWVNSFVIIEKDVIIDSSNPHSPSHQIKKKLRLCIDPKDLNEALEREPYYLRTVDELIAKFAGATVFTIIDMDKGYWQVELHPNSRKYTCMALDIGRFQWKRLPMGTVVASDVFQRKLDSIYIGLPGVTGIADDMIIYGKSDEEHDRNLIRFLETTRKNGLRLNKDKLQFKKDTVSFFGHVWSARGISPDLKKINSILNMELPGDKETMHSFLGLVNFLNRYSPKLANLCTPLRELIAKDVQYRPTAIHEKAFRDIKEEFRKKITLPYFSKEETSTLQTDTSKKGFGAVLIQKGKLIYFASHTLSPAEKNYQNLERECMAAVWGMEKFHYYLYGTEFILQTDQRPLVSIFKKHMLQISPRIQRIAIRTWPYTFTMEWIPGKENLIADALSRVSPEESTDETIQLPILTVNFLSISISRMGEDDLRQLRSETTTDPELQALSRLILEGWPEKPNQIPETLRGYWSYRDELTIEDGIIMKNHRFIVPKTLKTKYLERIHEGHLGVTKCLQHAREYLFLVNYSRDIQEEVDKCTLCQENNTSTTQRHKFYSDIPPFPWHTVGSDIFYHRKQDYLVLEDYFSKFLIVRKHPNSTSGAIIKELGLIFSKNGRPCIFRSDNGPCYASQEFRHFLQELDIQHRTSSPYYPQGNGLAESMVKVSKRLIEKAILADKPWYALILDYRITPISSRLPSPAEIFYGWRLRSNLSLLPSQMMNNMIIWLRKELARKEGKFEPREHTPVENLDPGQPIWYQDPSTKRWNTGTVREKLDEPQSYSIDADNGAIYRRNRNSLKPRQTTTESPVVNYSSQDSEKILQEDSPKANTSGPTTTTSGDTQIQQTLHHPTEIHFCQGTSDSRISREEDYSCTTPTENLKQNQQRSPSTSLRC